MTEFAEVITNSYFNKLAFSTYTEGGSSFQIKIHSWVQS